MESIFEEIKEERRRQDAQWGEQNHPSTRLADKDVFDDRLKEARFKASLIETLTWSDILEEEVYEALSETNPDRLREELIQVAAVTTAWIECLDRNWFSAHNTSLEIATK